MRYALSDYLEIYVTKWDELVEEFLRDRFRKGPPDEKELRRAADALARRGFSWGDVKAGLSAWADGEPEE